MKRWIKCMCVTFVIMTVLLVISFCFREQKSCCLCSSFRYHAPCLIDLNTGKLVELALYTPHQTRVAELAEVQSETSTFSFITLGDASGIKLTGSNRIEMNIPNDRLQAPALCRNCRDLLPPGYKSRYIFADLYNKNQIVLIPMEADQVISLRCYQITTVGKPQTNEVAATIRGTL